MRQKLLVLLLITGMLAQSLSQFTIYVSYYANRQYITNKYCINKNKPTLHCLGKCHLKTVFTENEKQEKGQLPGSLPMQEWWQHAGNLFCCAYALCLTEPLLFLARAMQHRFIFYYGYSLVNSFFHPPQHA
ncbi:hypothetical protein C7N43_26490 [Sphingobacteriales bacterium UPWRP_1]|nr:hypothetical protein B6N25_14130 [Sphingobacteriales bacterium TSM_CSS]PSJ73948.1 hypothetical protein C7N43_26490 [Sphingobacteriales bacterium UPWRP_1]